MLGGLLFNEDTMTNHKESANRGKNAATIVRFDQPKTATFLKMIREGQGKTLEQIANHLTKKTGIEITVANVYYWLRGGRPRDPKKVIETAIYELYRNGRVVDGGAWCEGIEAMQIMATLTSKRRITEISRISGIPVTTLYTWNEGQHRVPRKKINNLVRLLEKVDNENSVGA